MSESYEIIVIIIIVIVVVDVIIIAEWVIDRRKLE